MTRVIGFFDSQAAATSALDALYAGDFGDADAEVYETGEQAAADDAIIAATPSNTYAAHPAGAIAMPGNLYELDFDDEAEATWFARSVRNQGVLVVAEVDDEHAAAVERLFRQQGGRTYEKE